MTTVRIAHVEPWPGKRGLRGHGFTAAGPAGPRQMTTRIGYALALAAATGAPVRVVGQVMDQLAVPAQDDLLGQFTRDVPLPRPKHHRFARLFRGHPRTA